MTETQPFDEFSSRSAAALAENYLALWNEPDADLRRRSLPLLKPDRNLGQVAAQSQEKNGDFLDECPDAG